MTRHSGITRLIEAGMYPIVIIKYSGHTTTREIEQTYGHALDKLSESQKELSRQHHKNIMKDIIA